MLRGTRRGLELYFGDRPFEESMAELREQIYGRPEFYRGTSAIAIFEQTPQPPQAISLLDMLAKCGITLSALGGRADCEAVAQSLGLLFAGEANREPAVSSKRRKLGRRDAEVALSEAARSLVADFEGARKDRAGRRPLSSVRVVTPAAQAQTTTPAQATTPTLFHGGTLRGGQAVAYVGNVVIVGDVNPGAEVVASADIVIFGTLRGVAHAGAQGDTTARVFALELAPTQLRIASLIAADFQVRKKRVHVAECALIIDGRICVVPHDRGRAGQREALH